MIPAIGVERIVLDSGQLLGTSLVALACGHIIVAPDPPPGLRINGVHRCLPCEMKEP